MKIIKFISLYLATCVAVASSVNAEEQRNSKDRYSIFDPVPEAEMRGFSTDRPDRIESPYSVDAGHFQIESDLIIASFDRSQGTSTETVGIATVNAKVGITNYSDLQLVFTPFSRGKIDRSGSSLTSEDENKMSNGTTDLTVRFKQNLMGNDYGDFAIAVMPTVTLPTGSAGVSDEVVSSSLIVPASFVLEDGYSWNFLGAYNLNGEESGPNYNSYTAMTGLGIPLLDTLSSYVEIVSDFNPNDDGGAAVTFDFGAALRISKNIQLDAGVNIGVSDRADDWTPFLGFSARR